MRVKARAVLLIDGRLIVAEQRRRGRTEHSLPGGRVNERESVLAALKREVAEETGLDVTPGQLVYVPEIVESVSHETLRGTLKKPLSRSGRSSIGSSRRKPMPSSLRVWRKS